MPVDKGPVREERTRELTGFDASIDEAEIGDAGNGADPFSDLVGYVRHIEDEPAGEDIQPDEVRRFPRASWTREDDSELEITAQPNDHVPESFGDDL